MYKLPRDRLYVTYFEGDPRNGLEADLEARQFWLDQGVEEDHLLTGNAKDNFWGMWSALTLSCKAHILNRNGSDRAMRAMQV